MTDMVKLTSAQRAVLEAMKSGPAKTVADILPHVPRGYYSLTTDNRVQKILARLEARGLVEHLGKGRTATWYLTLAGRSTLR